MANFWGLNFEGRQKGAARPGRLPRGLHRPHAALSVSSGRGVCRLKFIRFHTLLYKDCIESRIID